MNTAVITFNPCIAASVGYTQTNTKWERIKQHNATPIYKENSVLKCSVETQLESVDITIMELCTLVDSLSQAWYEVCTMASEALGPSKSKDWAACCLPGEVKRLSVPRPRIGKPVDEKPLPIRVTYGHQDFYFDKVKNYWYTPSAISFNPGEAADPKCVAYNKEYDDSISISGAQLVKIICGWLDAFAYLSFDAAKAAYVGAMLY